MGPEREKIYHVAPQWQVYGLFSTKVLAACLTNGPPCVQVQRAKSYDTVP